MHIQPVADGHQLLLPGHFLLGIVDEDRQQGPPALGELLDGGKVQHVQVVVGQGVLEPAVDGRKVGQVLALVNVRQALLEEDQPGQPVLDSKLTGVAAGLDKLGAIVLRASYNPMTY